MNYNLILNVPSSLHLGHYDEVSVPDGDNYYLQTNTTTTTVVDESSATMESVVESGTFEVVKKQRMTTEQVYTTDPDALPKVVHNQLMTGKIKYPRPNTASALMMRGTQVVNGRKLLLFVIDISLAKVQQFIDANALDWTIECHQPFKYTRTEEEDGSITYNPQPSKGIKAARVIPFLPERLDDGGVPIPPKKSSLHGILGQSVWLLQSELA